MKPPVVVQARGVIIALLLSFHGSLHMMNSLMESLLSFSDLHGCAGVRWDTERQSLIGLPFFFVCGRFLSMDIVIGGLKFHTDGSLVTWDGRGNDPFHSFCISNSIALTHDELDELDAWLDKYLPWVNPIGPHEYALSCISEQMNSLYSSHNKKTYSLEELMEGHYTPIEDEEVTSSIPDNIGVILKALKASSPFLWEYYTSELVSDGFYGDYNHRSHALMCSRNPADVSMALCGAKVGEIMHTAPTVPYNLLSCLVEYAQHINFTPQDILLFFKSKNVIPAPHKHIDAIAGMMSKNVWVRALHESFFDGQVSYEYTNNTLCDTMSMMYECSDLDVPPMRGSLLSLHNTILSFMHKDCDFDDIEYNKVGEVNGLDVFLLDKYSQLVKIGDTLHICSGSSLYNERLNSGKYLYYQVSDKYLCEVYDGNHIVQFFGHRNSPAPDDLMCEMKEFVNAEVN